MAKEELKLEVYASKGEVCDYNLHVYDVKTQVVDKNVYQAIRGVCRKLSNYNKFGIFEDGKRIYSMKEIKLGKNKPSDFELEYQGLKKLKASENKHVFEGLIKYYIKEKLRDVYIYNSHVKKDCRKYSTLNDILSSYVKAGSRRDILITPDNAIKLRRKYDIKVQIGDDNKAYLWITTNSVFESSKTIAQMMEKDIDIIGKYVKNEWASFSQTGIIESVGPNTVTDKMEFGMSLKDYYRNCKKEGYRVNDIPDDTPVINVRMDNSGSIMGFYPEALRPIVTREYIKKNYPDFSLKIDNYVKRDMMSRISTDTEFINDIGVISEMGGLSFETECCSVDRLGFKKGVAKTPTLLCGEGNTISCGEEYKVFNYGFYMKPEKLKIGYLYPKGQYELMKAAANAIYSFSYLGAYQGMKDKYIHDKLLDIQTAAMIKKEYEPGSITDYKCAAQQFKSIGDIDLVIALIPDMDEEDSPYNPFKAVWAEENIPSQMITMSTARLFQKGKAEGNKSKYYLYNIVLGILGKTGGVPWVVENMPGDVDCFVGLDVSTPEKGLHVPACSVVFDKHGRLINFYRPKYAQKGEKIGTHVLQEIFDNVIMSYQNTYKKKLKSIVIHRDGFSNEDKDWYDSYFGSQKISYSIIEIRKNIGAKMLLDEGTNIENPSIGSCVYNDKMAYLITTDIKKKKGSPNPLIIEKCCGNIEMSDALKQIFYLTQLHVGSTQKTRLPITTGYADKICKNINYVPAGRIENKLFFL